MYTESKKITNREKVTLVTLNDLIPENHIVRKLEKLLDLSFIYPLIEDKYSQYRGGRYGVDPVVIVKVFILNYFFGIGSIRKTIENINYNNAYRWYLGYSLEDKVLDHSTISLNYKKRFEGTNLFEVLFKRILKQIEDTKLINYRSLYIDSTYIKANANKRKYTTVEIEAEANFIKKH